MQGFFDKIQAECDKQDAKWGADRNLHPLEWVSILSEEVGEVSKEINDAGFRTEKIALGNYEKELIQVAAVACQMIKNIKHYKEENKLLASHS